MRFSLWPSNQLAWPELLDITRFAEAEGWDGVWVSDHFMAMDGDSAHPATECWTAVSGLAAAVPRLRIGTLVSGNTYRHPAVVAKMAATVDHISNGRFVLGLGAGWQRNEHDAYGIHFGTARERSARLEEACELITRLLAEGRVDHAGTYYRAAGAAVDPKPVNGRLRLLVGGGGERRTLAIAARFADEWNTWGLPDTIAGKARVLTEHCRAIGRDPDEIGRSAQALIYLGDDRAALAARQTQGPALPSLAGTPADMRKAVDRYAAAGVQELVVPDFNLGPAARKKETLQRFLAEVASHFR